MTKHETVLWRRNKVQELLIKGYNQTRIAKELQVSNYYISNDVKQLKYQAKESMKEHLEHRLPLNLPIVFRVLMKYLECLLKLPIAMPKMTMKINAGYYLPMKTGPDYRHQHLQTIATSTKWN